MPLIHPKGSPSARVWVIADTPYSTDIPKGYMFSGGAGYVFDKMMKDAGIHDYYVMARRPDTDDPHAALHIANNIQQYQPPFIIPLDSAGMHLCSELKPAKGQKSYKTQLAKYVGSLLSLESGVASHSHYVMPLYGVEKYIQDWSERNISTYFDLQKVRVEYEFWRKHGRVKPLPFRQLEFGDMSYDVLRGYFNRFGKSKLLSVDIETCYPKGESVYKPHPGYPITVGIADSSDFGISFNLFRDSKIETMMLWRELNELLSNAKLLGQNFFSFDSKFFNMLGFDIRPCNIVDTMLRHHILWPELPHKLQFQTRQYTREPYYKDEGHNWNLKDMRKLRRYNCLDVCVTYEVWEQQEEEFAERKQIA